MPPDDVGRGARRARLLSLWMPGLGQLYNGDWLKGVGLLAASALVSVHAGEAYSAALVANGRSTLPARLALHVLALTVLWLWGMHDAHRSAGRGGAPSPSRVAIRR